MSDLQKIWQEQPEEANKVTLDEIRRRAGKLHAEMRWKTRGGTALGIVMSIAFAWTAVRTQAVVPRIGFGILSLWSLYYVWFLYKWLWPSDGTSNASVDYYRAELERQRDNGGHVWRRSGLTWCFVGLALVLEKALLDPRLLKNTVPFFSVLAVWVVAFLILKRRKAEKLTREIEELKRLR